MQKFKTKVESISEFVEHCFLVSHPNHTCISLLPLALHLMPLLAISLMMTRTEDLDPPLSCHFGFIMSLNMYSIQVFIVQPPIHGNVTRRIQVKFVVTQNRQSQCTREFGSTMALNCTATLKMSIDPVLLGRWASSIFRSFNYAN